MQTEGAGGRQMAKFCPHCGNQLSEDEKFCPVCGTPVEKPAAPAQPAAGGAGNGQKANSGSPNGLKGAATFQPQRAPSQGGGKGKWIAGVVLLLLLATGAGIFFAQQKDGKSTAGPKPPVTQEEKKQEAPAPKEPAKSKAADQGEKAQKDADKSYGKITGTDVRLRAGAGTNTDIVDYFEEGEKVEITGRKNNWYQVKRDNGQTGYVSVQFCRRL